MNRQGQKDWSSKRMSYFPQKDNEYPLKIDGWKIHVPFNIVPFPGDIR